MTIFKAPLLLVFIITCLGGHAQTVSVYKIDQLLNRIHNNSDTVYVVNFWATWCKPCVAELPEFETFNRNNLGKAVKVILVSMDFKEDLQKKLIPFLKKNNYTSEVVLLDEINGNDFINKINGQWSGAIPATLITTCNKRKVVFVEKKVTALFLEENSQ